MLAPSRIIDDLVIVNIADHAKNMDTLLSYRHNEKFPNNMSIAPKLPGSSQTHTI